MRIVGLWRLIAVVVLVAGTTTSVVAQEPEATTREAAIEQAQAEKVKLHEAMLTSWEKTVSGRSLENMRKHCNDVIASARKAQKAYEAMAEMHAHMGRGKL